MEYKHVKTIQTDKYIANVYSPILDDVERARRYEEIKKAAEALLKS